MKHLAKWLLKEASIAISHTPLVKLGLTLLP
jgi:hypothetical protein